MCVQPFSVIKPFSLITLAVAILPLMAFYPWRIFCDKTSLIGQLVIVIAHRSSFATYHNLGKLLPCGVTFEPRLEIFLEKQYFCL